MLSGSSLRVSRNLIALMCAGTVIFLVSQISFSNGRYRIHSWPSSTKLETSIRDQNGMLGVAARLYVLSLPSRSDRREDMEELRQILGLRWTYMDAMDTKNVMIQKIMDAVQSLRETNSGQSPFTWPDDIDLFPTSQHIGPWSPGFFSAPTSSPSGRLISQPMLCATKNNSIKPYDPDIPEYLILTSARIACWYSHLSLIEMVANDNTLKEDNTVIILEDDIDMERDIGQRLKHVWTFLPHDWDIVFLGHCWSDESVHPALNARLNNTGDREATLPTFIHPSNGPSCTHAYAISRSGARRILLHLRYPLFAYSRAIDKAISWLIQCGRIKSYSVVPSIVVQRKAASSDIMPGRGSNWKDTLVNGVFGS